MKVAWYCIPVADTPDEIERAATSLAQWKRQGYETAVLLDRPSSDISASIVLVADQYIGWAWAVNKLAWTVRDCASWVVTGGADVWPDPRLKAWEIADICQHHFGGTYGVMQPCGDCWGALADRSAATSPWIGHEWMERMYYGRGPLWPEYKHYYADAELSAVAELTDTIWWNSDIGQRHDHYLRRRQRTPDHLLRWQSTVAESKQLFDKRKSLGFPGHT